MGVEDIPKDIPLIPLQETFTPAEKVKYQTENAKRVEKEREKELGRKLTPQEAQKARKEGADAVAKAILKVEEGVHRTEESEKSKRELTEFSQKDDKALEKVRKELEEMKQNG